MYLKEIVANGFKSFAETKGRTSGFGPFLRPRTRGDPAKAEGPSDDGPSGGGGRGDAYTLSHFLRR